MSLKWEENWQRSYRISLGNRKRNIDVLNNNNNETVGVFLDKKQYLTEDDETIPEKARVMGNIVSEGYDIRGFTFRFDGTVSAAENGDNSEVSTLTLYNLDPELVDIINSPEGVVIIEAGYQDKVELAYTGDIDHVDVSKKGSDTVYTIKCTSAGHSFRNSIVSLQYDESISEKDIIIDMARRFPGLALGSYGLEEQKSRFRSGGTNFYGMLHTEFQKLMARNGLSWCVFNGKIVIIPYRLIGDDLDKFNRTKYILDPDSIKRIQDKTDRKGEQKGEVKEQALKLVINTFFTPAEVGQFIEIPDVPAMEKYTGTYIIKGRRLVLSSKGGAWDSVFDVEQVI